MLTKNNWVTTYVGSDGKRTDSPITTHGKDCRLVDPTTEGARKYVWSLIETGYYQYGIKIFWLVRRTLMAGIWAAFFQECQQ